MKNPISNIRRTKGSQFTYDVTWTCGHTTTECGNGPNRAFAHRNADRERAEKSPCYSCAAAARRGERKPLVIVAEVDATEALLAECKAALEEHICEGCGVTFSSPGVNWDDPANQFCSDCWLIAEGKAA